MEEDKDIRQQHHESMSNPEKSFEAGKKGGKPSTETSNQSSNVVNSPKTSGSSTSSGDNHSRVDPQNRPTQGAGWQSDRNSTDPTGKKS
ncbi:hypothetical protein ACFSKU_09440 [Pontibacter silvestris]|uniref:Uncharacterized protein n=1 Tax=Pontibacter silvestris TaxID=2305183 RepID=A0ABW4WWQ5_9BACT|nr:hypothetical protein [Pontibacter silvestris]MCC9137612.1 hypothetical protein [Pontibacter silvestris]